MPRHQGFSLFELLVVLVLMGLVVSLVAPSVSRLSRQAKIESEVQSLSQLIYQISVDAYSTQSVARMEFDGNELRVFLSASIDTAGTTDTKEQPTYLAMNESQGELGGQLEEVPVSDEPIRNQSIKRFSFEYLRFPSATVGVYPTGLFDKTEVGYQVSDDIIKSIKLVGVMAQ